MKVVWIHPDLGIGGAERFVVNVATHICKSHELDILVTHFDASRCFDETHVLRVRPHFSWIPRNICGLFHAFLAYTKGVLLAMVCIFKYSQADVVIVDQVATSVPILRLWFSNVVFYCHFPDALLASSRGPYRQFLKCWEMHSMKRATKIFVNSKFTQGKLHDIFCTQNIIKRDTEVLYPYCSAIPSAENVRKFTRAIATSPVRFLSLNRIDPAKEIELAIHALKILRDQEVDVSLDIAGGVDDRISQQKEYLRQLIHLCAELNLSDRVSFHTNVSEGLKARLLESCVAVVYTPPNEHFGLVPLECLSLGVPVIAQNNGGPSEMLHSHAFLCDGSAQDFSKSMMDSIHASTNASSQTNETKIWIESTFNADAIVRRILLQDP